MMTEAAQLKILRQGIADACQGDGNVIAPSGPYPLLTLMPHIFSYASDLETALVEGYCGAGKSFLYRYISSEQHLSEVQFIHKSTRGRHLKVINCLCAQTLSGTLTEATLNARTLTELFQQGKLAPPSAIWKGLIAQQLKFKGTFSELEALPEYVAHVHAHPKEFEASLHLANTRIALNNGVTLLLFDGLDQIADTWENTLSMVIGLLQVARELRKTSHIRCKVFLRPDILDNLNKKSADAAALWPYKHTLSWRRSDCYMLLFHRLANHPQAGEIFRDVVAKVTGIALIKNPQLDYFMLGQLREDEDWQTRVFHTLSGPRMGSVSPFGPPYVWLINYLQDSLGFVSPRSFLAALGAAAKVVDEDCTRALDWRAIAIGVREGWKVRRAEIDADHPWVRLVMQPLKGKLTLPFSPAQLEQLWLEQKTLETLPQTLKEGHFLVKLPPRKLDQGAGGVIQDLAALGILQILNDGKIQMNDLYRHSFGFGRQGGPKPATLASTKSGVERQKTLSGLVAEF